MIKNLIILLFAWLLAMTSSLVMAKDLVVDRSIFEDPTGQLGLESVKKNKFDAAPEVIFKGFSRSTFWIKLTIDIPHDSGPVSVRIRPTLLDRASLFYRAAEPGGVDGVEYAQSINERSGQQDTRIALQPGTQTLFIRFASLGGLLVHAQVLTIGDAIAQDLGKKMAFGAMLAVYLVSIFITLGLTLVRREKLILFLLIHLAVCFQQFLMIYDIKLEVSPWKWDYSQTAFRLFTILNFLSFSLLMQAFISRFELIRLKYIAWFGSACFGILGVSFFIYDQHLILKLTAILGPLIMVALLGGFAYYQYNFFQNDKIALNVRVFFGLINSIFYIILGIFILHVLGVMGGGEFLIDSPAWRGLFIPLYLLGFLWYRDSEQSKALSQTKIDKAVGTLQIKDQANRLATQSEFMAMLMHEIKTPLFTIQLVAANLGRRKNNSKDDFERLNHIEKSVGDINFIVDQCIEADKLDRSEFIIKKSPVTLENLFYELQHLPGHERLVISGNNQTYVLTDIVYSQIILKNLIGNALKYSDPDSLVCIDVLPDLHQDERVVLIRVSNSVGKAGRPDPDKVFKRYYRGEGAKMESGAGLGLWLAQTLAAKLGSELSCKTEHDRVNFYFPLEMI